MCGICSELTTIKTPEGGQERHPSFFFVNFEHIWYIVLVSSLLTLSKWIFTSSKTTMETPEVCRICSKLTTIKTAEWGQARGASHQPAFMSGCLTISHTCVPCLPSERMLLSWWNLFVVGREVSWQRWESSELGRWEMCMSGVRWQGRIGGRIVRCRTRIGGKVVRLYPHPSKSELISTSIKMLNFTLNVMEVTQWWESLCH